LGGTLFEDVVKAGSKVNLTNITSVRACFVVIRRSFFIKLPKLLKERTY
jgi:hypothetical protein